jgi:GTPase SAR1 family protein
MLSAWFAANGVRTGQSSPMSIRPVRSWGRPGTLVDALVDTRRDVAAVELPFESPAIDRARVLVRDVLGQLDEHLIPRTRELSTPAIVVVGGSTGAGKSTIVNALVGESLTPAGVLRPTTMEPHLFHHPADREFLSSAARRAILHPHDAVPRGIAVVDSPDLDSLVGANRDVARELLDAADLWLFVTTAARYGDALPWEALRLGAQRGASIAIVLNRVSEDAAGQVRHDLVERLRKEGLESLPFFVIPEQSAGLISLPPEVISGLKRWLDSVAAAGASAVIERTLVGASEAVKKWLEELAELMDERAAEVKEARGAVRRAAAQAEQEGADLWYRDIAVGPTGILWSTAAGPGGALFRVRGTTWAKRRSARTDRDVALGAIRRELEVAVRAALTFAVSQASGRMVEALGALGDGAANWLVAERDPGDAAAFRENHATEATTAWLTHCDALATGLPGATSAIEIVGREGLGTVFASAVLGIPQARQVLALLVGSGLQGVMDQARAFLANARRHAINTEALAMIRPSDLPGLAPDESAVIRLRRAELRSIL